MGASPPPSAGYELAGAGLGYGGPPAGPTGGQVFFDILFGLLAPATLFVTDPALFSASVARQAALPPYWAGPLRIAAGALVVLLLIWGLSGMRHPLLGSILAGVFAFGALLFAAIGAVLLPFALTHADLLSGWVALGPWLTTFVFARHCVRAIRAGAAGSLALALLLTVVLFAGPTAAIGLVCTAREQRARGIEGLLFSSDIRDHEDACAQIRDASDVDFDRVVIHYESLKPTDPRRPRVRTAYLRFTGLPIEGAIERLFPRMPGQQPTRGKLPEEKDQEDPKARLLRLFFSADSKEHDQAVDELIIPDPEILKTIVRRFVELDETDPRRERITRSYSQLAGEPIAFAVKRLRKRTAPMKESPGPKPKAPATAVPATP